MTCRKSYATVRIGTVGPSLTYHHYWHLKVGDSVEVMRGRFSGLIGTVQEVHVDKPRCGYSYPVRYVAPAPPPPTKPGDDLRRQANALREEADALDAREESVELTLTMPRYRAEKHRHLVEQGIAFQHAVKVTCDGEVWRDE